MLDDLRPDHTASKVPPLKSTSASILVIDDDAAVLHSLSAILEDAGFLVHTASDGVKGLAAFRAHRPTLVLTDIIMPEKEGIAVTMEIRRECPSARIIAMSGGGRIGKGDFLEIASELGADATLAKPFDGDQLLKAVLQAMKVQPYRRTATAA
jgi:two-component system, chemotaxis family, chemotaxis protein CheY